ncbi:PREDICTED: glutamate--cysteine ligase catalytic subunit-like [Priapulus caudatus]|uniref:Glutamate--cysteine ligase n=1 Tax=Priapulus caudatus TaxID=37621 RepID=A0ABM1ENP1_PRICU|nr:PREDICTED: glutamate--cysteine ligase catalytic subunit-like [Priapulus caudatus]XP_014673813.1 PREDICTED: glutamate--cysteine ligase catalytic subunit-like [Priapulus caudatus]
MGLLTEGSPLNWDKTREWAPYVREHGIKQLINLWRRLKDVIHDELKWGDEVEYTLIKLDHASKTAKVLLKGEPILRELQTKENNKTVDEFLLSVWRPEYANYMVEGTPGTPYGGLLAHFNIVEANMRYRRAEMMALLDDSAGETALSLTAFPRLGCPGFTEPPAEPRPETEESASRSLFYPDEAIFPGHPRFRTLTRNIRHRRREKVAINIPVFRDEQTRSPFREDFAALGDDGERGRQARDEHIYMDSMGFGMGCSCLQVTFQACCVAEGRLLYDQLTPLCPILLALSAASPVYRGYLSDVDCRWDVIAASVDDRTRGERSLEPLADGERFRITKSRYDSVDMYIHPQHACCNDVDVEYDAASYEALRDAGLDETLAKHFAHLFIRDPVALFSEKIHIDDEQETDHFENIQSTNWQTMRFKPPPPNSPIGWRVEFRPCEVQLTDFENAAYVVFVVLLTRVILSYQLNFVVPISKVDENMREAQKRDAVRTGRFWFAKDLMTRNSPPEAATCLRECKAATNSPQCAGTWERMGIDEIVNGKEGTFPGLVPLMQSYMQSIEIDVDTACTINQYLALIQGRAAGRLKTFARYTRDFVTSHAEYGRDSVVSPRVTYDFIARCDRISRGEECPELFGGKVTKTADEIPTAVKKANSTLTPQ